MYFLYLGFKTILLITIQPFSETRDGQAVYSVKLKNKAGMEAHFLTYGAILQRLIVPTGSTKTDVVLGYEDLGSYEEDNYFIGQLVGRNANRIANAEAVLDGKKVQLSANEGKNQLHGGFESFGKKVWSVTDLGDAVLFTYTSPDGDEGFPGNLETKFYVKLEEDNTLAMRYEATTDKETIVNLTRHEYFNMDAASGNGITHHQLQINASAYLPKTPQNVPSGELKAVADSPFDLQKPVELKERIAALEGGFDHNFVLNEDRDDAPAAQLISPDGKLKMELYCTQPGIQFYSANGIADFEGKHGKIAGNCPGLCLEPQHFPDAPNHEHFPTTVLKPSQRYEHDIRYTFSYE
ncbi:MAG: galactose-1-epimerase [Leeuwenhoekiella sp.]|nr:MAG: galactose-1-epimerase [Leeuwenhoekiella sp.]